jgi:hypothetical protein
VDEVLTGLSELRGIREDGAIRREHFAIGAEAEGSALAASPTCNRAVFCAWSSPRVSALTATTSATPTARPRTVRIVRPLRRSSSLRSYVT